MNARRSFSRIQFLIVVIIIVCLLTARIWLLISPPDQILRVHRFRLILVMSEVLFSGVGNIHASLFNRGLTFLKASHIILRI